MTPLSAILEKGGFGVTALPGVVLPSGCLPHPLADPLTELPRKLKEPAMLGELALLYGLDSMPLEAAGAVEKVRGETFHHLGGSSASFRSNTFD